MARSDGELEAIYRFLNNPRVTPEAILEPHVGATVERAAGCREVNVVLDPTQFAFEGPVEDELGYLPTGQRGFFCLFSLVLSERLQPLGIAGLHTWFRDRPPAKRGTSKQRSVSGTELAKKRNKESQMWSEMIEAVHERLADRVDAVYVMDRGADSYPLMADLLARGRRFVIRLKQQHDRGAAEETGEFWEPLGEVVERARYVAQRQVLLSRRKINPSLRLTHGSRPQRWATLHLEAMPIILRRPRYLEDPMPWKLTLNLVRVHEVETPLGEEPVEWWLLTTDPIDSQQAVEQVVDRYRGRWKIEEFIKAVKTGCGYEQRGLESRAALLRALAVLVPLAWQLLALRDQGRLSPDAPATDIFTPRQLRVLRAVAKRALSQNPTLEEALLAVAGEGGHLMRNGAPGWQSLGRGLEKLWWAEVGYVAGVADRRASGAD